MNFLSADRELTRNSYYAATAKREVEFSALEGQSSCDVAIVGGGLAGLSAAIELADRGFSVTLLEAKQVGWGASGRNGGQAIHGLACEPQEIESQLGLDEARKVFAMTLEALDLIRARMQRFDIDCDWHDGYLGVSVNPRKSKELRESADHLRATYNYPMQWVEPKDIRRWIDSPRYHSAVHDPRSGHLHPLKYSLGLARAASQLGVRIHENSAVTQLIQGPTCKLRTAQGELTAKQVLLAGNVYLQDVVKSLEPRIMPVGTYIVCSEKLDAGLAASLIPSRSAVCDNNFVLDYFRPTVDDRMLFGGRVSYSTVTPANLADSMKLRMIASFPQLAAAKIEYAWGGFVDISMNRAPDFGRLPVNGASSHASNVYYVQGFSGHGLALTGMAGRIVAEAMAGDASRFDVFARLHHRNFPGGRWLRMPSLVLGMAYHQLKDAL